MLGIAEATYAALPYHIGEVKFRASERRVLQNSSLFWKRCVEHFRQRRRCVASAQRHKVIKQRPICSDKTRRRVLSLQR